MSNNSSKPRLLAGFYDPDKRNKEVLERLEKELERFRQLDFTKDVPLHEPNTFPKEKTLESIKQDIDKLAKEVEKHEFPGQHFSKQYRTFQGGCDKLLQQLDSLNVENNEEEKTERGNQIERIQKIVADINSKVHPDGKCCTECELHGTRWQ